MNACKVSRSGIELFTECPCCFYLNNRLGIRRPSGPPFNINKAIDELFKKEFDRHRAAGDARRVLRRAAGGEALACFPEGTFSRQPGVHRFHAGAFVASSVVAVFSSATAAA